MSLPSQVREITRAFLSLVDDALPGHIEGLYLYGSIPLRDYRPGSSDIDFVAVCANPCGPTACEALRQVHHRLAARFPRPHFDGIYLTWDELAATPAGATGAYAFEGDFHDDGAFERGPVTWQTLSQCGLTLRGPDVGTVEIGTNADNLSDWLHGNLDDYWRNWWFEATNPLSSNGIGSLGTRIPTWGVLGVSRLHYTLATGKITSKTGAGEYAKAICDPRWHRIIDEALRIHGGFSHRSAYLSPFARRTDMLDYIDWAIEDAHHGDPAYRRHSTTQRIK